MNKNLYRLVFNAARGMLVAVPECAIGRGKGRLRGGGLLAVTKTVWRFAVPGILLGVWMALGLPVSSHAQVAADPHAGASRPTVVQTANGIPQVNITRPSAAGVSTNGYTQFDVPRAGVILNNSPTIANTQQAGYVNGNPNLVPGGSARIIINNVNSPSASPSQLRGYIEVAGPGAEVVVANPNGLLVDGLGFINTTRATLTTGTPVFGGSGSLDAYRVTGGQIAVQGDGLNAANLDQVDLIARAVQANAAIYANQLNVIAGASQVDRNTLAATPVAASGAAPALGIDVGQLGGMYANKIRLASTEHGVGVSLRGVQAAQAGDLTLTAQGKLVLAGQTNASGNIVAYARDGIDNTGTTYAKGAASISTDGALGNTGTLAAQQGVNAYGGSVHSTGTLAAGVNADGTPAAPADLAVVATHGAVSATGRNVASGNASIRGNIVNLAGSQTSAGGNLDLSAGNGDLDLTGATTTAGAGLVAAAAGALINDRGNLSSAATATLTAGTLSNNAGQIVSQGATRIQTTGAIQNGQGVMQAGGALEAAGASLDNTAGRMTSLNGDGLTIHTTGALVNAAGTTASGAEGGVIGANGHLQIAAGAMTNHGQISAQGNTSVTAGSLDNDTGSLVTGGALATTVAGAMSNRQGTVSGASTSIVAQSLDNTAGNVDGSDLAIRVTGDLTNRGGAVRQYGASDTSISAGGTLDNAGGNITASGQNLAIQANTLANDAGKMAHAGAGLLDVTSQGAITNAAGAIQTNGALSLRAASLGNAKGHLVGQGTADIVVQGALNNVEGEIHAADALTVTAVGDLNNANGSIEVDGVHGSLSASADNIDNTGGRIANAGDGLTQIRARQTLLNSNPTGAAGSGLIGGNGDVRLDAAAIANHARISAGGNAGIGAATLDNSDGTVTAAAALTATVSGATSNQRGTLSADTLKLDAASLDNSAGHIEANQLGVTTAGGLVNRGGRLDVYGTADAGLQAGGTLDNTGGEIAHNGANLKVQADILVNDRGRIVHAGAGTLGVITRGAIRNTEGAIQTNGDLWAQAGSLDNTQGVMSAQHLATIQSAGDLLNRQGTLYGKGGLTVTSGGSLDNAAGSAQSGGELSVLAAGALTNVEGTLAANGEHGQATVTAASIDNTRGDIANAGDGATTVTATVALNNTAGTLGGNGNLTVNTPTLTNTSDGTAGGYVAAGGALNLNIADRVDNRQGTLYAGNGLTLDQANTTLLNDGGQVLGKTDVNLQVASLSNAGGAVKANQDIAVAGAVAGSGTMTAGRNLALEVSGDYTNDAANHLHADGDMQVSASGTLTNTATLAAAGALTASATRVVNAAGANINSTSTTVTAVESIDNAGRIEGDTVHTHSATVANTGTVIGNNVTVQGTDITNDGAAALMAAAETLNVYATNSVRNLDGATLYSAGNLQIARDGERDASTGLLTSQVATLINRSANIEAERDIDIAAGQVSNARTSIVTAPGTPVTGASQTLAMWDAGMSGTDLNFHESVTFPTWRWSGENAQVSASRTYALMQPVTVTVDKTTVSNLNTSTQTFAFTQPPVEEYFDATSRVLCSDCPPPTLLTRNLTSNPTQSYQSITDNGGTYTITFWPDYDPARHIRPDQVQMRYDLGADNHDYTEIARTTTTTTTTDQLVGATDAAKLQAGGSIRINSAGGSILNQSSIMAAGGDLIRVAPGGGVQDVGTVLQQLVSTTDTSTFYWHQKSGGNSDTQVVVNPTSPQAPTTVMALPAIASANGEVTTQAQDISIASVNRSGQTVTGSSVSGGGATGRIVASVDGVAADASTVTANGAATVDKPSASTQPRQTLGTASAGIPNLTLPTNGLYRYQAAPGATYLIATDPRFTQYGKFISSDYMLGQLGLDPMMAQKRLGDGFYEQKLVRDQVTQLTGRTYLAGYSDQLAEYQALMDAGVQYAKAFQLAPGVGLSETQMAQLTTDMVWLVSQDVTLPDGSHQTVLVPKLYLAQANAVDLQHTGALVTAGKVSLTASGDIANSGAIVGDLATQVVGNSIVNRGQIGGTGTTVVKARQDVRNVGGRITGTDTLVSAGRDVVNETQITSNQVTLGNHSAGATSIGSVAAITATKNVGVLAGRDINMAGGAVSAGNNALLGAGRDVNLGTVATGTTQDSSSRGGQSYYHDQTTVNVGSSVQAGGKVVAVVGRDATLTGSAIDAGGNATLVAARNTTVTAAVDTHTHSEESVGGKGAQYTKSSVDESVSGSSVRAGNNASLAAGQSAAVNRVLEANGIGADASTTGSTGNLSVLGSSVTTDKGAANLVATGDVTVGTVTERHTAESWSETKKAGFLSKEQTTRESREQQTIAVGSLVSSDSVSASAGRDMTVAGSTVVATHDVDLAAGRDLAVRSAQNTSSAHSYEHTTKSGLGATGSGISYGKRDQKDTVNDTIVTQSGSLVGSTDGSVHLNAGNSLKVTGSDLIAAMDVTGVAADVTIEAAQGSRHHDETHEVKQSGFTLGVSGGAIGAALNAGNKLNAAGKSEDSRATALWGIAAARDAFDAGSALAGGASPTAGAAVTLSWGSSQSKQTLTEDSTSHTGSRIQADGTVAFMATGVDANGNHTAGNLNVVGSDINANKVALGARNDINIVSATDTDESHSTNKSSSASVGVSYGTQGFGVSASASKSKGNADSVGTTQVNSQVNGNESVTLVSGKDTSILGGTVSGGKVVADVGGDLNLASRQDTEESHARQQSTGGGFSISQGGGSASFSASKGKADGSYANVAEQSGIYAGEGGFDINVNGNTDLKGAVIASDASKDKNSLSTGTLSWSDAQNHSDYSATSMGFSAGGAMGSPLGQSSSGPTSGKNTGGINPMIPQHKSGSEDGVAQAAVAEGTIKINDGANQKQDLATLQRDTSNTNTQVGSNPDLDNLLNKQADMMSAAQAAGEAVAKTVGDVAGAKLKEAQANAKQAREAGDLELAAQYDAEAKNWEDGGSYRAVLHAAGGALVAGLGGGNALAGAAGAGVASLVGDKLNELARAVAKGADTGNADLNETLGNLAANIAAGGIGVAVGGGSGAATAANVDRFNRQLHPDEKAKIHQQANGDKASEERLTKAACFVVKCWSEYPVGSDAYNKNYVSVVEAGQLGAELNWVHLQQEANLFVYSPMSKSVDALKSDPLGVAKDAAKVATGFVGTLAGGALCTSSAAGCVPGSMMASLGTSDMTEGATRLMDRLAGDPAQGYNPLRSAFTDSFPTMGATIYDGLNLASALLALNAQVPLKLGVADGLNRPSSMFGVTVPAYDNIKLVPIVNWPVSGANQALLLYGVGSKANIVMEDIKVINK